MVAKQREKSRRSRWGAPIGVFDSGVGGLSILRHLRALLPRERFVFLADQAYVPYGTKTGAQLKARTERIARFLLSHNVKLIVVACNTATCYAIEYLRHTFSVPFVGTVPALKPACARSRTRTVAVLSTPATAKSTALKTLIRNHGDGCTVLRIGCAGLEEAVEHGSLADPKTLALLRTYVARAKRAGVDRIVLGCTHYPFLKGAIRNLTPIPCIDSGRSIARHTRSVLKATAKLNGTRSGGVQYWTTGDPEHFSQVASRLLRTSVKATKTLL